MNIKKDQKPLFKRKKKKKVYPEPNIKMTVTEKKEHLQFIVWEIERDIFVEDYSICSAKR